MQTVITPISDPWIASVWCFKASQLHVTGAGNKTEEQIKLLKTGIQYGPYIILTKGKYEVEYSGNNLHLIDDYRVTADIGKQIIHNEMVEKSQHYVKYVFLLDQRTRDVEFVAINHNDTPVEISSIKLRWANGA